MTYAVNDAYRRRDVIMFTVTFGETVTVTGKPEVGFDIHERRRARYVSGSGTTTLTFRYEVRENDVDTDGVSVPALEIVRRFGTIRYASDDVWAPGRVALAPQAGHKVDGVRPTVVGATALIGGNKVMMRFDRALDESSVPPLSETTFGLWDAAANANRKDDIASVSIRGEAVIYTLKTQITAEDELIANYSVDLLRVLTTGRDFSRLRDTFGNYADRTGAVPVVIRAANQAPAFPSSETGARSVPENSASGVRIGAPVAATDAENDSLTYSLGGIDANSFTIVPSTGQLQTKSGVTYDREIKSSYSVTVSVHDGKDIDGNASTAIDATITVTITLTDVNEPPVVDGPTAVENYTEGGTGDVATYSADDPENNTIIWSVAGTDRDDFTIGAGGVLRFAGPPNFEAPTDSGSNNDYRVTVVAYDGLNTVRRDVTVTVENIEEPGTVSLSSHQPQVGTELTATLTDPDGSITSLSWIWERSQNQATWTLIDGATSRRYTPADGDENFYLRVTASYTDGHGGGKSELEAPTEAVRAAPIGNRAPEFPSATTEREIAENSPATRPVGAPVAATDLDNDRLAYTLSAGDRSSFTVDGDTGQIRVKEGAQLNREARSRYSVTVTATDPSNTSDSIVVAITVTDVNEAPVATDDTATTVRDAATVIRVLANDRDPERQEPDRLVAFRGSPRLCKSGSRQHVHLHTRSRLPGC